MPDNSELAIEPTEGVAALIREMVRGDLLLRQPKLSQIGEGCAVPAILFAREMRGKLSISLSEIKKEKLFFFFKTHSDTERIADIRIRFALVPSLSPRGRPASDLGVALEPPVYLVDSGNANRLHLRLTDNRQVVVQFREDDSVTNSFTIGLSGDKLYDSRDVWPLRLFIMLIEGMADQIRANETGNPRPFKSPAGSTLYTVLETILSSYSDIIEILDVTPNSVTIRELDARLRKRHPDLGGNYRFSELFSRILVWIGENGELILNRQKSEGHQLDVEARLLPVGDNYELRYRFRIPDLLISGEYHQRFLQAVRSRDHAKSFRRKAKSIPGEWSKEAFQDFLEHPDQDQSALFIRISRRTQLSPKDRDLVLLRGPLAGRVTELLFKADFDVDPYPDVTVNNIDVKDLLGFRLGDEDWQWRKSPEKWDDSLPQQYMIRLLYTLLGWQKGMVEAAFP